MSSKNNYIAHYEAIAAISARMLSAARKALWNEMTDLQAEYRSLVDRLRDIEETVSLDENERIRKYNLIRQILADDAAIRDLANPSVARLSAFFSTRRPVRMHNEYYGAS